MLKKTTLSIIMATGFLCNAANSFGVGVVDGKLEACGSKPNCVSTSNTEAPHAIEPWVYSEALDLEDIQAKLIGILLEEESAVIRTVRGNYIHAEFTSKVFKFVDDVEFLIDEASHSINVRSASRTGYFDFRVNLKRVNKLKEAFLSE